MTPSLPTTKGRMSYIKPSHRKYATYSSELLDLTYILTTMLPTRQVKDNILGISR